MKFAAPQPREISEALLYQRADLGSKLVIANSQNASDFDSLRVRESQVDLVLLLITRVKWK